MNRVQLKKEYQQIADEGRITNSNLPDPNSIFEKGFSELDSVNYYQMLETEL